MCRAIAWTTSREPGSAGPTFCSCCGGTRLSKGYDALYAAGRSPGPNRQALCWSHGRRKLFELADIAEAARRKARGKTAIISPIALETVKRIDALFDIERDINGRTVAERLAIRQELSAPCVAELGNLMR